MHDLQLPQKGFWQMRVRVCPLSGRSENFHFQVGGGLPYEGV